jgi:hypothetical protein
LSGATLLTYRASQTLSSQLTGLDLARYVLYCSLPLIRAACGQDDGLREVLAERLRSSRLVGVPFARRQDETLGRTENQVKSARRRRRPPGSRPPGLAGPRHRGQPRSGRVPSAAVTQTRAGKISSERPVDPRCAPSARSASSLSGSSAPDRRAPPMTPFAGPQDDVNGAKVTMIT